ncbi:MAG: hypothetical protein VKJ04_00040 [Vampirovibrionales bacterium]|nr:hypothetical protein [Vampirovibrionales bacterium]
MGSNELGTAQGMQGGNPTAPQAAGMPRAKAILPPAKMRQLPDELHLSTAQMAVGGAGVATLAGFVLLAHNQGGIRNGFKAIRKWGEGVWNGVRGRGPETSPHDAPTELPGSTVNQSAAAPEHTPEANPYSASGATPPPRGTSTPHEPPAFSEDLTTRGRRDSWFRRTLGLESATFPSLNPSFAGTKVLREDPTYRRVDAFFMRDTDWQILNTLAEIPKGNLHGQRPAFEISALQKIKEILKSQHPSQPNGMRYTRQDINQAYRAYRRAVLHP